ncbi:DUF2690 domain-containing protein [Actinacidiphila glaucinigra]|uniref:DUF2690 domain-containing protein n=1 Tax=Actinacidiphila glaucinigra TaxID=235986 RepID=UPI0037C5F29C
MDAQQEIDALGDQESRLSARAELAQVLKRWREAEPARSQAVMAKQLFTNQPTVSRWESGKTLPAPQTVRDFWRVCTQSMQSAPSEAELERALTLLERAEKDRGQGPKQTPALASTTQQPDASSSQPWRKKGWLATGTVVAAALVTAVVWAAVPDGGTTPEGTTSPTHSPAGARPAPTARCDGASCASLEPAATTCSNDAITAYTGRDYGVLVELRYSAHCQAAWAKMSNTAAGDRVTVTPKQGDSEEYRQQYGHDAHTRMVHAQNPSDAKACAMIEGRGTVCATSPASQ